MAITLLAKLKSLHTAAIQYPEMVIHFRELLQYYQGIFAYLRITYNTFGVNEGCLNLPEILKNEATIALPRHDEETPKNTFSALILALIVLLHSVSLGKLSLSQDLFIYEIIFKTFYFFSLGTVICKIQFFVSSGSAATVTLLQHMYT